MADKTSRLGPYRAPDGLIFGVAKGLADYFGMSAVWMRLIIVGLALFTAFWPVMVFYAVAAFIMPPVPKIKPATPDEVRAYRQTALNPELALKDLSHSAERLERRLRRLEDVVTSKDFDWQRRFRQ